MREDSPDKKINDIFKTNRQISIFFNAAKDSRKVREQEEQRALEEKLQKERVAERLQVKARVQEQQKAHVQEPQKTREQEQQKKQEPEQQKEQEQEQQKEQEQGKLIVYHSNIELVTANNIEISAPVRQGVQVFLEKGDNFLIRVKFQNETYEFKSSYIYRRIGQNPVWIIQTPSEGKKIQQRIYPRINFSVVIKAQLVKKPETNLNHFDQNQPARLTQTEDSTLLLTKDISAGGLRVISKLPYSLNSELNLSFEIPNYGKIKVLGQVLRVQTYRHENMMLFFNGIKFLDISEKDFHFLDEFVSRKQSEVN